MDALVKSWTRYPRAATLSLFQGRVWVPWEIREPAILSALLRSIFSLIGSLTFENILECEAQLVFHKKKCIRQVKVTAIITDWQRARARLVCSTTHAFFTMQSFDRFLSTQKQQSSRPSSYVNEGRTSKALHSICHHDPSHIIISDPSMMCRQTLLNRRLIVIRSGNRQIRHARIGQSTRDPVSRIVA